MYKCLKLCVCFMTVTIWGGKMTVYGFFYHEYSLIISIVGTVIGLIMSIVGATREKETVKKIGIGLLFFFLLFCIIVINVRYGNNSTKNPPESTNRQTTEKATANTSFTDLDNTVKDGDDSSLSTTKVNTGSAKDNIVHVASIGRKTLSIPSIASSTCEVEQNVILKFWGSVFHDGDYTDYSFYPDFSGVYRFEFSDVPDGTDFKLYIYNSGYETKKYEYDLDNGDGITISLDSGNEYIIRVQQYRNVGAYCLNVGQQKPLVDISSYTAISDSIQYNDQENNYSFIPENSGTHRFEFSNVPDGTDLALCIYNSGWEVIKNDYDMDNGDGITTSLSKGEVYYIKVSQYRDIGSYDITVGHKKEITAVSDVTFVSDSVQYTDQLNDYEFVAKVSGVHRFEFSDVPNGTDLELYVYNSGWEVIKNDYDMDNGDGITVSLSEGQTYYIRVGQYRSTGLYTLNIGIKKNITSISKSIPVSDSIQYTDQENDYSFFVSGSGDYKFALSNVPDGTDFEMYIYNSGWEQIEYGYDLDEGDSIKVSLSSNEEYFIRIAHYRNYGKYNLKVTKVN